MIQTTSRYTCTLICRECGLEWRDLTLAEAEREGRRHTTNNPLRRSPCDVRLINLRYEAVEAGQETTP